MLGGGSDPKLQVGFSEGRNFSIKSVLFLALLALGGPATAQDFKQDPTVRSCLACIFQHSSYGNFRQEAAAWLVKEKEGFSCRHWPMTYQSGAITWKGVIPAGRVALFHTHPNSSSPKPSGQDEKVATQLYIPNFVITQKGVWAAFPISSKKVEVREVFDREEVQEIVNELNEKECADAPVIRDDLLLAKTPKQMSLPSEL